MKCSPFSFFFALLLDFGDLGCVYIETRRYAEQSFKYFARPFVVIFLLFALINNITKHFPFEFNFAREKSAFFCQSHRAI